MGYATPEVPCDKASLDLLASRFVRCAGL